MKTDSQVANEDEVQFPPGNSDLSVCLADRPTNAAASPQTQQKRYDRHNATSERASEGTTKYTVCPPAAASG